MSYEISNQGKYDIVHLTGEVDLASSPRAREAILGSISAGRGVLVDLGQVTYIDSSGVASLVEGYQTAKNNGTGFGLVNVSEAAMNVLQLARLDKVFPIYDTFPDKL